MRAGTEKPPLSAALANVARSGRLTPEDERLLSKESIYNAHVRTTCVTTQLAGSPQDNVLIGRPDTYHQPLAELLALTADGRLRPIVGGEYPLAEARRVHEDLLARRTVGKLLIDPNR